MIAVIARFQGSSRPDIRERLIKLLPAQLRGEVIKATAILRLARALNQGRRAAVHSVQAAARGGDITISVKASKAGAELELWAAEKEVPYFREVFGRELLLRSV